MANTPEDPNDEWIDEVSFTDSEDDAIQVDVLLPKPTNTTRFRGLWAKPKKKVKKIRAKTPEQPNNTTMTLPRGRYRMEMVATTEPSIPFIRRFLASDFLDLTLALCFWAGIGVGIYFLEIEVPSEYHTVVRVAVSLLMLPLSLFTLLHFYEIYLRRVHATIVKIGTN